MKFCMLYNIVFIFLGYDVIILFLIVFKDWYCDLCFCGGFILFIGVVIVVFEWFLLVVMWMFLFDECKRMEIIISKLY